MKDFDYLLSLFIDREGTRILVGEYASNDAGTRGKTWDIHPGGDLVYFHSDLIDAWVVMTLDEVTRRPVPETPAATKAAVIRVIEASQDLDAKRILEKK